MIPHEEYLIEWLHITYNRHGGIDEDLTGNRIRLRIIVAREMAEMLENASYGKTDPLNQSVSLLRQSNEYSGEKGQPLH